MVAKKHALKGFDHDRPVASFKELLADLLRDYEFDVEGLYVKGGHIRPLPAEPAVVGKVVEITIDNYLLTRLLRVPNLKSIAASSDRVYPDVTFNGPLIHPHRFAVDVKCARVAANGKKTESAISIGTYDAEYFRYPDEKVGNIMMPYSSYSAHLSIVALYRYEKATARDVELLVVEKWRVATKKRSSGTRCYIGASQRVEDLRAERGDFESEEEFNDFWRGKPISERKQTRWRSRRGEDTES